MHPSDPPQRRSATQQPYAIAIAVHGDGDGKPPADQPASGLLRVLILEDDPDIRETLSLLLCSEDGFATEAVKDVASCLARLRACDANGEPTSFDVLVLDFILRGGHLGTEVLREAAKPGAQLRLPAVVVCTAHSSEYLAKNAPEIATSNVTVVLKPFSIEELMRAVHEAARGQHIG